MDPLEFISHNGTEPLNRFYSVYRGLVRNNQDPHKNNALLVYIPEVLGGITVWAYPRGQQGGPGYGLKGFTPSAGEVVYITFEDGDASMPLWEYHGWAKGEAAYPLNEPGYAGIVTPGGNMIILNEKENELQVMFKGKIIISGGKEVVVKSNSNIVLEGESIVMNQGENQGLVKIKELTEKLNQTLRELEQLKLEINTHTHTSTAPGTPTSPPTVPMNTSFTPFNMFDYMDEKTLH